MPKSAPRHKPLPQMVHVHRVQQPPENYGKGRGGRPWRRKRDAVMKRDAYQCQECKRLGLVTLGTQVDHVIPQAEGGTDLESNLQTLCGACHEAKSRVDAARGRNGNGSRLRRSTNEVPRR